MAGAKRVTISDVARAAGVSRTAVSFAFNNPTQVSTDTAERILTAARDLGYSPNPIARALNSQRTGVIGILVPGTIAVSFANPFIAAFMQGVGSVCGAHGLSALIVSPLEGSLEEATRRAPVDGYIILGLNQNHHEIEPLRRRRVPLVVVDAEADSAAVVNSDDEAGARAAALHFLTRGHRDILVITFFPPESQPDTMFHSVGRRRLAAAAEAFAAVGQHLAPEWIVEAPATIEGGAAAFGQAWAAGRRPTAVLAHSDVMALGAIREAARLGLRVPDDLEVIGFDDVPLAALTHPALSTVRQPILEKGQIAAELLVAALDNRPSDARICLPTELVLRGSTR